MTRVSISAVLAVFEPSHWSARSSWRVLLALIGTYLFITFAAPILMDEAGLLWLRSPWLTRVDQFWLYGCVILIAGWTALGPGRLILRGAQGLIGVGWLLLLWLLGLTIAPNYKHELEPTTLVCLTLFIVVFTVLFALRLGTGEMLLPPAATGGESTKRFQYSLTTLLLVMLLVGLTITLFGWVDQRYVTRTSQFVTYLQVTWSNGFLRRELASDVFSEAMVTLLIAAACLPAFWSRRFRGFVWAFVLSAAALLAVVAKDVWIRERYVFYPQIGYVYLRETIEYFFFAHLGNLVAVTLCLLIAAAAMHWLGYRLSAAPAPRPPAERP